MLRGSDDLRRRGAATLAGVRDWPARFRAFRKSNRPIWLLALFIFFWNFSPSIGYIERSYLIDVRDFGALSFGIILSAGSLVFLASILVYRWVVRRFPSVRWDHYLYAMIALAVLAFPLSFFLYLDPDHPWWGYVDVTLPAALNPLPDWNRYQWFRLIVQTVLGFASIPAFMIPLTVAGETVKLAYAGMGYAFLTALANTTNLVEGLAGAGLNRESSQPWMAWLVAAFRGSALDIAGTADERTLILEVFVYLSLLCTLLTIPFLRMLKREADRRGVAIRLGRPSSERVFGRPQLRSTTSRCQGPPRCGGWARGIGALVRAIRCSGCCSVQASSKTPGVNPCGDPIALSSGRATGFGPVGAAAGPGAKGFHAFRTDWSRQARSPMPSWSCCRWRSAWALWRPGGGCSPPPSPRRASCSGPISSWVGRRCRTWTSCAATRTAIPGTS